MMTINVEMQARNEAEVTVEESNQHQIDLIDIDNVNLDTLEHGNTV